MSGMLYCVVVLCCMVAHSILFSYDSSIRRLDLKLDKAYRWLSISILLYYIQDIIWGLLNICHLESNIPFYVASILVYLGCITIAFVWLNYVLLFLGSAVNNAKLYRRISAITWLVQISLVIVNHFNPIIFQIGSQGEYIGGEYRYLIFSIQYLAYLLIGIVSIFAYLNINNEHKEKYLAIVYFVLAPIIGGLLQFFFPQAPFNTCGYFWGYVIIHSYVISEGRHEYMFRKAYYDELTKSWNRSAFEMDVEYLRKQGLEDDFTVVAVDVNGLKKVNDLQGHAAGDELIMAAVTCLKRTFENYGRIYRIGGDEFILLLEVDNDELTQCKQYLQKEISIWKGKYDYELALACGYVSKREFQQENIVRLLKLADEKMYADKAEYYKDKEKWR